jgi:hypothetical protein
MEPTLSLTDQTGPVAVTLAYLTLYYAFQVQVLRTRFRLAQAYAVRGEKFDRYFSQDREMLAADRVQLNTLEHMGPFLALLWLHAVFVSPFSATVAGTVYTVARAGYPMAMGTRLGRAVPFRIFVSTVPGYVGLAWLAGGVILTLLSA